MSVRAELWPELHGVAIAILVQMIDWVSLDVPVCSSVRRADGKPS